MKKPALIAAAVAIAAGAYVYTQKGSENGGIGLSLPSLGSPSLSSTLAYIPEDSLFFYGNYEQMDNDVATALSKLAKHAISGYATTLQQSLAEAATNDPSLAPINYLFNAYTETQGDAAKMKARFGFSPDADVALYTIGAHPVLRIKLSDEAAFNTLVADLAKQAPDAEIVEEAFQDVKYKSLLLSRKNEENFLKFIIAVHEGFAVLSFSSAFDHDKNLADVLGINKPTESYANGTVLKATIDANKFVPPALGLINIQQIINGITTPGANRFAENLSAIKQAEPSAKRDLDKLQSEACQKDFGSIAATWPQISFGFTQFEPTSDGIQYQQKVVFANSNNALMTSLQGLRGAIAGYIQQPAEHPLLGLGLGLNVDNLGVVLSDIQTRLVSTNYSCEPLQEIGPTAQKWPLAMLPMVTMQAAGLHGISVSVIDLNLDMSAGMPQLQKLDAIIGITAKNPRQLFSTLTAQLPIPGLAQLTLPEDGSAVDLPVPLPPSMGLAPKIAVKGNQLVIFNGAKSESLANALSTTAGTVEANGLISFAMDMDKFQPLMQQVIENNPMMAMPEFDAFKASMGSQTGKVTSDIDITNQGIEINSKAQLQL